MEYTKVNVGDYHGVVLISNPYVAIEFQPMAWFPW